MCTCGSGGGGGGCRACTDPVYGCIVNKSYGKSSYKDISEDGRYFSSHGSTFVHFSFKFIRCCVPRWYLLRRCRK